MAPNHMRRAADGREGVEFETEDQLQPRDSLIDRGVEDVLDEGFSPPDHEPRTLSGKEGTLDDWLDQEEPDEDPYAPDHGVADQRAGRLVAPDEGLGSDDVAEEVAREVGIDGGGASAEEAAVHIIDGEGSEDGDWV